MIAEWMQTFVAVAEAGSFSAAATGQGVTQSTVSKQVAALESHLEARLFQRTTRSLALTEEGQRFYDAAKQALAAIDEAKARISAAPQAKGLVRVTCPQSLAERKVAAMVKQFLDCHPGIAVELVISDRALNLVSDNLDMAIRVGQLVDSQLIARRIGVARRMLAASPEYLARAGVPVIPADLKDHDCVLFSLLGAGNEWRFTGGRSVRVNGRLRANCPSTLRAAALAGADIVQSARWLFEDDLATGRLLPVLPDFEPEPMPIHAVLPSGHHISARTRIFLDFLAECFAQDPLCRPD
ncbi:LysR family transcriptional regulator [Alteraurantiacibacter palmitatis]|uniref:LysR substrate-binding domain-containing protein n=1 Tax=Alteraurantiacibacter palmitatis TaxID=2054628 RepID=A0ABV7E6I8_9SPHN